MITLITGNPGAGKTLYCISNLLRELVGSVVKSTDSHGRPVETPRTIYANIPGLLLDHELIDGSENGGLANWHEWAKPGAVIVYDEVQREWKPRANGSKVPKQIEMLETHRHLGIDFIILTQHPGLIDANVRALVGRHLHVRRFGGIGAAIVYEWDHCSRSLLYSKALAKKTFRYDKKVFDLYKSAELHTKPKTSIPPLAIVVVLAIAATFFMVPYAAGRIGDKSEQAQAKPKDQNPTQSNQVKLDTTPVKQHQDDTPEPPAFVEPDPPFALDALKLAGSMQSKGEIVYVIDRGGATVAHHVLEKAGYAFVPINDCAVRVNWYATNRIIMCDGFAPAVSPKKEPPALGNPSVNVALVASSGPVAHQSNEGWTVPARAQYVPMTRDVNLHEVWKMFPAR
jgi:zona occludens toxin